MADVLIALGGNVGDVRATFQKAIANICGMAQAALLARSSDYTTSPWGDEQQARFTNACIEIETSLDPHALLFTLHKVEHKFGRDRTGERCRGMFHANFIMVTSSTRKKTRGCARTSTSSTGVFASRPRKTLTRSTISFPMYLYCHCS